MTQITRRAVLATAAAALAAPHIAREAHEHRCRHQWRQANAAAYYKPFIAKTGIEIVNAVNTYSS
jgi:hypothetical protein